MNGSIFSIKRFAVHDGDGIRTTVFLKGCTLACRWCHNPEGISFQNELAFYANKCIGCGACLDRCPNGAISLADGKAVVDRERCNACGACVEACLFGARELFGEKVEVVALADELAADKAFFESSGGGVTVSGGECLAQSDFVVELLRELQKREISVAIDTCGFVSREALAKTLPYTDVYLYDLKAYAPDVHKKCTGQENGIVLENLAYLCDQGCRVQVRIPFVKGWNDGEIKALANFMQGKRGIEKITVLRYHDMARSKYAALGIADTMPENITEKCDVEAAVELLKSFGLPAVAGWED